MQRVRAAHKWICYHGAPRGVRRRIPLMQRPGDSEGNQPARRSRRAAGTGRTATAPSTRAAAAGSTRAATAGSTRAAAAGSTRAAAAGSWGGARCGVQGGSLGSSAATAGALVRRLVHASLRMRGQTSTPACGRGGGANSAPSSRLARAGPTAAVRAPRENRRAVAYRPESQAQPPGPGHDREDRTRFGAQQEAKAHLMDSQLAWRDLAAKRLRACHEIPPALSLR